MSTPNYQGQGQPTASSGGWLSEIFGGHTPTYAGAGQPVARTSTWLRGAAPAYAVPTTQSPPSTTGCEADEPRQIAIVIPRQVIDPQP